MWLQCVWMQIAEWILGGAPAKAWAGGIPSGMSPTQVPPLRGSVRLRSWARFGVGRILAGMPPSQVPRRVLNLDSKQVELSGAVATYDLSSWLGLGVSAGALGAFGYTRPAGCQRRCACAFGYTRPLGVSAGVLCTLGYTRLAVRVGSGVLW